MSRCTRLLAKEFQDFVNQPEPGISIGLVNDDITVWRILLEGPQDTLFASGLFKAEIRFPDEYPDKPPKFVFKSEMYHPNIFTDGSVCISILHAPGDDPNAYEQRSERWLPVHSARSVILSVVSMLGDPNPESPANVDAAKMFRENSVEYKKRVLKCVRKSQDED
ncbi:Ubiquitin-conjugating_enzyme E2 [Hexamita inflata]|uniref:Ubiquitin-conjugating enzyme E2 n=1 Tax=Hexamita inflata TaxID=28002 RepID=A0AA86Q5D5_9EUKA|nr:Ubiquitin-conjugating enzyme E2 [Hexamita inflata]CAI9949642.1 Ubiquitin-conjugating enzyme E2 [Hexamita inflata]